MKTSGLFEIHKHEAKISGYGKTIKIIFFGDVHRDSPSHCMAAWGNFLNHARAQKDALFVGMGDYLDSYSTSERLALSDDKIHDSSKANLAKLAQEQVEKLAKELAFMKGRLIGLIGGNHYFQFQDGTNSDQRLCRELDCKFLGVAAFVRLYINIYGRQHALDFFLHHGTSGGKSKGASINSVDKLREIAIADIYAMGHNHDKGVVPAYPKLYLAHNSRSGLEIKDRQSWLIRSGSFLKAYEPGRVSYNVDAARGPCALGHVELHVTPMCKGHSKKETWVDIKGVN